MVVVLLRHSSKLLIKFSLSFLVGNLVEIV